MKKINKIIFAAALGLLAVTSEQLWTTQERTGQKNAMGKASVAQEPSVGGAFTLTDENGKTLHDSDFRGRVMLVAFGFTHCSDICPATLLTFSKVMELLGSKADQVAPLFISVDPSRDTPAVLKDFLSNFDKHITGLTGTGLQVRQVADAYKAYYAKGDEKEEGGAKGEYGVDHSGYIYMMGRDGQFLRAFPYDIAPDELARAVTAVLQ